MHFHRHRERHMRGRGSGAFGEGWGGGPWGGRHGHGGGRRMFEQGAMRLLVLQLIAEQRRHGYEIIKTIEERAGGSYAPSPGVIYPQLNLLEEQSFIRQSGSDGAKKLYEITEEGQAELAANASTLSAVTERISAFQKRQAGGRSPQILRAMQNLHMALKLRTERGDLSDADVAAIADALDNAAKTIERT